MVRGRLGHRQGRDGYKAGTGGFQGGGERTLERIMSICGAKPMSKHRSASSKLNWGSGQREGRRERDTGKAGDGGDAGEGRGESDGKGTKAMHGAGVTHHGYALERHHLAGLHAQDDVDDDQIYRAIMGGRRMGERLEGSQKRGHGM